MRDHSGAEKAATGGVGAHKLEKPPLADQMHVVLWVIKADDIRFEKGMYSDTIKFFQHMAREQSELFTFIIMYEDANKRIPERVFYPLIPTQNFEQSRNPNGYFRGPTSCAYFQSRNPDVQIREIPYPEKPIGDPHTRPCSHYNTKIDIRACKKFENLVVLFAPETRERSYVNLDQLNHIIDMTKDSCHGTKDFVA